MNDPPLSKVSQMCEQDLAVISYVAPNPYKDYKVVPSLSEYGPIPFAGAHDKENLKRIYSSRHISGCDRAAVYLLTAVSVLSCITLSQITGGPIGAYLHGIGVSTRLFGPLLFVVAGIAGELAFFGWGLLLGNENGWRCNQAWNYGDAVVPFRGVISNDWCEVQTESTRIGFDPRACRVVAMKYGIVFEVACSSLHKARTSIVVAMENVSDMQWQVLHREFPSSPASEPALDTNTQPVDVPDNAIAIRKSTAWRERIILELYGFGEPSLMASMGGAAAIGGAFIAFGLLNPDISVVALVLGTLIITVSFPFLAAGHGIRSYLRRKYDFQANCDWPAYAWITDEAIWLQGKSSVVKRKWDAQVDHRSTICGVSLELGLRIHELLPRFGFSSQQDWESAVRIIEAKALPRKPNRLIEFVVNSRSYAVKRLYPSRQPVALPEFFRAVKRS